MRFDPNQTDFPSPRHRAIWDEGRRIVPLEVSLADVADPGMREGCTQIYNWTREYFARIYEDPSPFAGQTPFGMFRLLDDVAEDADITGEGLVFGLKKYRQLLNLRKYHLRDLPLVGLEIVDGPGYKTLVNKSYPLFCKYFKLFYEAAYRKKVNRSDYLACNDFRVLAPKYNRTLDDLLRVLPDTLKAYAAGMNEYALEKGAKLESHRYYAFFRYKYKKETLLMLKQNWWRYTPLDIAVPYGGLEAFLVLAEAQPDGEELIAYIQKELCACDACDGRKKAGQRCGEEWVNIRGVWRLPALCHRDISKWKASKRNLKYSDYDIQMLKRMIDIRVMQIDKLA